MELGKRKQKAEAAESPAYPGFMTWDFCFPLKSPNECAQDYSTESPLRSGVSLASRVKVVISVSINRIMRL